MLKLYVALQTQLAGLLNRDDRGATAVEYGLLVALIALVVGAAAEIVGTQLSTVFSDVGAYLVNVVKILPPGP